MALIPADRLTNWTPGIYTGVPGGIDQYLPGGANERVTLINVTLPPYDADNTGVINCQAAVQSAIDAAGPGEVVYLPAGTYLIEGALSFPHSKDNFTIRGDGQDQTFLIEAEILGGASDGWNWPSPPATVTAGLTKGSSSITLDDATEFPIGAIMMIGFDNQIDDTAIEAGSIPTVSVGGYTPTLKLRRQVTRITNKVGDVLTIFPEIYSDPDAGLGARVWVAQLQNEGVGIESLSIDMQGASAVFPISLPHCYGCWVYDVEVHHVANYCVSFSDSLQCEVRHCTLRDRTGGFSSNGSALLLNTCSGVLAEDNIFWNLFPLVEVNAGSSGNAVIYNLFENDPVEVSPGSFAILTGPDMNHGPHNELNIVEGNVTPNFLSDGYFGSDARGTVYRNWINSSYLAGDLISFSVSLKRFTRDYSMVGNVMGRSGISGGGFNLGEPNIGNNDSVGEAEPSTGDFWVDWKATAELTDRIGDGEGEITLNSGVVGVGQLISIRWNSGANGQTFTATTSAANVVTWSGGTGDNLPIIGTSVDVFMHPGGYQEIDLDVGNTMIDKGNYVYALGGAPGSMSSLDGDPLIDSYVYGSEPDWWQTENPGLSWPPFDPTAPEDSEYSNIPAGIRFLAMVPEEPPVILDAPIISGSPVQGQTLTAIPGGVTGNPTPTQTWKWQRDGVDIVGATSITYLLTGSNVGFDVGPVQIETNSEGFDESAATPLTILAFMGDILVVTQVANAAPVTELWRRASVMNGVAASLAYYLVQHSGPYPTQPDNNFIYARFGTPQDHVYVFQGTVSEAEAVASVP